MFKFGFKFIYYFVLISETAAEKSSLSRSLGEDKSFKPLICSILCRLVTDLAPFTLLAPVLAIARPAAGITLFVGPFLA